MAGQSLAMAVATGLAQLLTAAIFAIAARSTTPAHIGRITAALALGTSLASLLDFGSNAYWVREGAAGRMDASESGSRAAGKLLVSGLVVACVSLYTAFGHDLLFGITVWVSAATTAVAQTAYTGLRRLVLSTHLAVCLVVERVTALPFFLVLKAAAGVGVALPFSLAIGAAAGSACAYLLSPPEKRMIIFKRPTIARAWSGTSHYGFASLSSTVQSLDIQVVSALGGASVTGVYTAVNRWTQPMGMLASAFAAASMPFVARARTWQSVWPAVRRSLWLPACAIVVSLGVAATARWLVPILLGEQYRDSAPVLCILALGTIPGILNQLLSVFLQARNIDQPVARALLAVSVLQLTLVGAGVHLGHAIGASLATAGSQLITTIWLTIIALQARRRSRSRDAI